MLRITVEKIPYGMGKPEKIAEMTIINTGMHPRSPQYGEYKYKIYRAECAYHSKKGIVPHFPRKRNVWELILLCLRHAKFG